MEKIKFEPIGKSEIEFFLDRIISLSNQCKESFGVDTEIDIKALECKRNDLLFDQNVKFESIRQFFSQHWGDTLHIKMYYKSQNDEWIIDKDINMIPYKYVPSNGTLYGLICDLKKPYQGGVQDDSLEIHSLAQDHMIEIEEVEFEDFFDECINTVRECIKNRIDKMNSSDYIKKENGYEHKL